MILYDSALDMAFRDYGIMLPILDSRASRTLDFLGVLDSSAFPGPVCDLAGAFRFLGQASHGPLISREDLDRVHQRDFVDNLFGQGPSGLKGLERILFHAYELLNPEGQSYRYEPDRAIKPLTALFDTVLAQVGATYLACRLALALAETGNSPFCYYLGGGMHHARYDSGSGFCVVNDSMIAGRKLLAEGRVRQIWVVDVDAHKGDGTAELVYLGREQGLLAAGQEIRTLSIHMDAGWPLDPDSLREAQTGRAPLLPSDIDIGISPGAEAEYVPSLERGLWTLEELSGGNLPDLAIVVDGADPYEYDELPSSGPLRLSLEQCVERDRLIYEFLGKRHIPSAWLMAGGYGDQAWEPPAHFLKRLMSGEPEH